MLHAGLVKLGAILCLLLQTWGGTGLDRASFCIRQAPAPKSCSAGCCQKKPERAPDTQFTSHKAGCCIQARLPDDPSLPPLARDSDSTTSVFALLPCVDDPIAFSPIPAPDRSPPDSSMSRVARCLASTRLRL